MRISGIEPSLVILSQTQYFKKVKNDCQKFPKQAEAKRDGEINPQNYNFNQFQSILLTKLLTHIKQGLQKYCETAYSRSGINQMWILKNSKELLEHLKSPTFNRVTSIKSFDFSTLYTTIPHHKLKDRLTSIIRNAFIFKNGNCRYKYLVLGHEERSTLILKLSTLKTTSSRCLSF